MNEEKKIEQIFGKDNRFRVPDGYFENLPDQIMARIPEHEAKVISIEQQRLWKQLPIKQIAAGVAVVALLGSGVGYAYQNNLHQKKNACANANIEAKHAVVSSNSDDEFEQMADYTMMDSQDIYASLLAEN